MASQDGYRSCPCTALLREPTGRLTLTGAEWVLVAVFAVASFALFGLNLVDAAANNRVYLGAAGAPKDSLQYLAVGDRRWASRADSEPNRLQQRRPCLL